MPEYGYPANWELEELWVQVSDLPQGRRDRKEQVTLPLLVRVLLEKTSPTLLCNQVRKSRKRKWQSYQGQACLNSEEPGAIAAHR